MGFSQESRNSSVALLGVELQKEIFDPPGQAYSQAHSNFFFKLKICLDFEKW